MKKARLITVGTEITTGEIVNTNAAWVSRELENLGVRVFSHLTVRDHRDEIVEALHDAEEADYVIVTGGLGPTSDDITRNCVAEYVGQSLEFDDRVWADLQKLYATRGLPLRESHKLQCYFPKGSERLANPVGTALGFRVDFAKRVYFVLPGPPRELEGMWNQEVTPRLKNVLPPTTRTWVRWTCLGVPESEVAEVVEKVIEGSGLEVGYRAQVPYVKVKVYADPEKDAGIVRKMDEAMAEWIVARGEDDLAGLLLKLWPQERLVVVDEFTGNMLFNRLVEVAKAERGSGTAGARVEFHTSGTLDRDGLWLRTEGEEMIFTLRLEGREQTARQTLNYKVPLQSERGRRSATEWALWFAVKTLRASLRQA